MTVNTAGGVKIAIGTTSNSTLTFTTIDQFEADSYTNVGEVEDGGQFGDEAKPIEFTALADARVRKFKGPYDAGTMAVVCGNDPNDDGQIQLLAAEATKFNYNIRVTLSDKVTIGGEDSVHYFSAQVMSERANIGNVMNVVKRTFNLAINTAIFESLPT